MLEKIALPLVLAAPAAAQTQFTNAGQSMGLTHVHAQSLVGHPVDRTAMLGGAAAADLNGDGWVDLFVTLFDGVDILYANRGVDANGVHQGFEDRTNIAFPGRKPGPRSNGVAYADVDNDGDLDLYITRCFAPQHQLWLNNGSGVFQEAAIPSGAAVVPGSSRYGTSAAFGDYNKDGWVDIYVAEWGLFAATGAPIHCVLLKNRGASDPGKFDDVTIAAGLSLEDDVAQMPGAQTPGQFQFTPRFTDLDDDGWPDLALAGDFGTSHLFWNNGDGTFTEGTDTAGVGSDENGMGATIADFDGDGRLDWFVTSILDPFQTCAGGACSWGDSGNRMYKNLGGRVFADATDAMGVRDGGWGWAAVALDYDNDGDMDLGMNNGVDFVNTTDDDHFRSDPMKFWRNDGAATPFAEISVSIGLTSKRSGKGMLSFDYDKDGDLDLYLVNNKGNGVLYRNDGGNDNDWLQLDLVGQASGTDGVGARVQLWITEGDDPQMRETSLSSNYLSQDEDIVHFGLGDLPDGATIHKVEIQWLSGAISVLDDVSPNQRMVVTEP